MKKEELIKLLKNELSVELRRTYICHTPWLNVRIMFGDEIVCEDSIICSKLQR